VSADDRRAEPATEQPPAPSIVRHDGPWTHRDISANGIRFHIAEAGTGPLILLLHGFAQYWWSWRHQLPALAAAGYRAVAPDLRGYGDTDRPPRGFDAVTLAADVAGLIRALGERDALVVGHGFGGITAFNAGVLQHDQVRGLVVIGAPHPMRLARIRKPLRTDRYGRLLTWSAVPIWPPRRLRASRASLVERLARTQAGKAWKATDDFADTMARMRQAMLIPGTARCACEGLRWMIRSPLRADGHRHREALERPLISPVLHIAGAADTYTPVAALAEAQEFCANGYHLEVIAGSGHFPAEEAPDRVTELIIDAAG